MIKRMSNTRLVVTPTRVFAAILLASMFSAASALAQSNEIRALYDRIDRLEQSLTDVQSQVYRGEVPPAARPPALGSSSVSADPPATARLLVRINELEGQIRALTGKLEELEFLVGQSQTRMDKLVEDVDFRLTAIERNMAAPTGAAAGNEGAPRGAPAAGGVSVTAPAGTLGTISPNDLGRVAAVPQSGVAAASQAAGDGSSILPDGGVKQRYDFARSLLRQGKYDSAERAFAEFVETYPEDALAGNAQYWLGESFYARKDYERAASAFLAGYQNYHESPKAPDNLLKLGITLNALGQKEEACAALGQLNDEFPNASTAIKQRVTNERRRAGCS